MVCPFLAVQPCVLHPPGDRRTKSPEKVTVQNSNQSGDVLQKGVFLTNKELMKSLFYPQEWGILSLPNMV